MSNILTIAEVLALPDGAPITAVAGTFEAVYPVYHGTFVSDGSPYTVQNVLFSDGKTKCRVAIWDHPDCLPQKGQSFVLMSTKAPNGHFGGVSIQQAKNKDKTPKTNPNGSPVLEIKVSKAGVIQFPNLAQPIAQPATLPAATSNVPTAPAPAPQQPASTPSAASTTPILAPIPPAPTAPALGTGKPTHDDFVACLTRGFRDLRAALPQDIPVGEVEKLAVTLFIAEVDAGLVAGVATKQPF
jgi:hypothetical protein